MTRFEKIYEAVSNKVSLGQITTEDFKNMMDIAFEKHVTESYDEPEFDNEGDEEVTEKVTESDYDQFCEEMDKLIDRSLTIYFKSSTEFMKLKNNPPKSDDDAVDYYDKLYKVASELSQACAELEGINAQAKIIEELNEHVVLIDKYMESVNPKATLNKIKSKVNVALKKCESLFRDIESKVKSPETKAKFAKLKEKIKLAKINGMKKGKALAEKFKASAKKAAEKAKSTLKKESEDVEETKAAIFESLENDDIDVDTAMELLSMLND